MLIARGKFFKEISWSFIAKGTSFVFFIALNIFLARYLGPELFGTWSFFFSILSILLLLSYFGINASARTHIAQYFNTPDLRAVFQASFKMRIIWSLAFAIVFLIIHEPFANLLGRPELAIMFLAATPIIFMAGTVEYAKNVFQGLHRIKFDFFVNASEFGLKLIVTVVWLLFANAMVSIVYSFNIAYLVTMVFGFYLMYYRFYKGLTSSGKRFEQAILRYSIPLFLISIGFVVTTEIDTIMIGLLHSDLEVGIYAVAKQIVIKLPHIAVAIGMGTMPVFARLNQSNREELKVLFHKLLKTNTIIFGGIGFIILSTSWFIIPFIFGSEYTRSAISLMLLVPYLLFFSYSVFLSSFMDYQGKAVKRAVNLSVAILLNIGLNYILIPRYGAVGAAITTSIAYIPYLVLNWLEVKRMLDH